MADEQKRFTRTLSRFELAIAVILIGIFIGVFVQRVILLTVASEATSLELMIRNLRTGVMLYVSGQLIEGRYKLIEKLAESDPFNYMEAPFNYGGSRTAGEIETAAAGQWFYDRDNEELVYKIINKDYFNSETGKDEVRIKFVLSFDDRNNNGTYEQDTDRPHGVSLKLMNKYAWSY